MISDKKILGIRVIKIVIIAIIKLEDIKPNPYKININILLLGVFDIPNDQKKKIALSSHGIKVCNIPKRNAGVKTKINGGG
jgi:hypothetical protein